MGGYGSGRIGGFGATKTSDYHAISLSWLKKENLLRAGVTRTITWSRGGRRTGSIGFEVRENGLRVYYTTTPPGGASHDVNELIPFTWTDTQFGGRRRWFSCPSCRRRCGVVYGGSYFRCRTCHGLQHASKYEPDYDRAMEKANRLRQRLGDNQFTAFDCDELPPKPPRMRWATYQRLEAEYAELQGRWKTGIIGRFKLGDLE